ncbi:radical SAM protein [Reichenbachiella sp. MSK19-1]|uniref:radical SAM protein n=1 Tax=Reichenbachiella sp. MSK19-1 TaxID=1897631 RepID=UPI000E6CEC74|nr:radical SAM protein [Reichenbachiella sp. MSK19-1]RJE70888.1 radical SAM protein [Reichenbachiella sp. MSK19-1]
MRLIQHPILCNYYVTYRCNAKCGFCDIWERPSPYVTIEQVETNLRSLKKLGVKVIDFTGGEPLLHRDIDHFFAFAKKLGFITTLTTNGLLYPKHAEGLKGKVDMLHFSLDTAHKEKHDTMRGVACYDHVMESIQIAKSLGERPDILMTVFEDNIGEIEKLYTDVCLPNDLILILNPSFEYNEVETGSGLSNQSLETLTRWGKKKNIYLNQAFIQLRRDGGNQTEKPVCKAASTTLVISPENELLLPCYHLGTKGFAIDGDLEKVYRSTEAQKLIKLEGRLPECQGCTINCYMQPSFAVEMNKYFWLALPSTFKYNWIKGTWRQLV